MRGNGGRIGPKYTPATGSASGVWSLTDAGDYRRQSLWPSVLVVPGAPTSVSATVGNNQATVSFSAPSFAGIPPSITGYRVTSSPGGLTATGASSPIIITGLTAGQAYTFTVAATNSVGYGPESAASNSVTPPVALYAFTNATFTPGGQTGTDGPTLAQARTGLTGTGTDAWKNNTSYFNTSSGLQLWTVPSTGSYTITAEGAGGGSTSSSEGGLGARIIGTVSLTEGHIIRILVGQLGGNWGGYGGAQGGGGGGTFVYNQTTSTLLIAAGGGGGALYSGSRNSNIDANTGTSGKGGWNGNNSISIGGGGDGGSGGACYDKSGGGGGGFSGNGGSSNYQIGGYNGTGGTSFLNGGQGATAGNALGGFGGGGGADWIYWTGAGGGGGYSGGGGGYYYGFGGGGGSYNAGTNQTAVLASSRTHGSVTITKI